MEHSPEELIRKKIADVENIPVGWNRTDAWKRIKPTPAKKVFPFYAVAASLLMGLAWAGYFWQKQVKENLAQRIRLLEETICLSEHRAAHEAHEDCGAIPCDKGETPEAPSPRSKPPLPKQTEPRSNIRMAVVEDIVPMDSARADSLPALHAVAVQVKPPARRTIQPVMGIVPHSTGNTQVVDVKKIKIGIDLFRPHEATPALETSENQ